MLHPVVSHLDPAHNLAPCLISINQKVKKSLYGAEQALRIPGG